MDQRALVRQGDALVKDGNYVAALDAYEEAARSYASEGFALKAVALWKQMREIIRQHAPEAAEVDAEARKALVHLYRGLGLESDALAIEAESGGGSGGGGGPTGGAGANWRGRPG